MIRANLFEYHVAYFLIEKHDEHVVREDDLGGRCLAPILVAFKQAASEFCWSTKHKSTHRASHICCLVPVFPQQTMSPKPQLQDETTKITPSSPVRDGIKKMSHKIIAKFVKELTVDRDFKVNDGGDIVMIRHLPVSRCTVALLRQICVWVKVSGHKNQNKESTLGLLKNLVMREGLKNKMYDDDSASYFSVSSQEQGSTSLQETSLSVEKTDEGPSFSSGVSLDTRNGGYNDKDKVPLREEDKVVGSDDADDHSNCSLTPTATHEDERAPSCSTITTNSKERKATSGSTTSITTKDAENNQTKKKEGGSSAIAAKRRGKKKSKVLHQM